MSAFLAGIFDAGLSARRLDAVDRAALSAVGLDPGVALLHGDRFSLQRLFDETFGFLAHRLLRHRAPVRLSPFMRRDFLSEARLQRTTQRVHGADEHSVIRHSPSNRRLTPSA